MTDNVEAVDNNDRELTEEELDLPKRLHWTLDILEQLITTKPLGALGGFIVLVLVIVAIFAPWIAPYEPETMHGTRSLLQPCREFWLGTDDLARDVFSRLVFGARVSLRIGIFTVLISTTLSTIIGILSAYIGGLFDTILQRIVDTMMCFPWLVIMLTIMAILGPGERNVILALVIAGFAAGSRVIRGAVMAIRESEYLLAARAIGCKRWVILVYHVLPNVSAPIIVQATLGLGGVILVESALSFLGFGVPPPAPSWGRALSAEGLDFMFQNPGLAVFPGLAIAFTVFGFNMLGDALRDLLDPRLQGTAEGRI
jgi:peptide/nickel transport system permease protein